jgi:hypothetical protein
MGNTVDLIFGKEGSSTEQEIQRLAKTLEDQGVKRDTLTLARFIYGLDKTKIRHPSVNPEAFISTLVKNWEEAGISLLPFAEDKYINGFGDSNA